MDDEQKRLYNELLIHQEELRHQNLELRRIQEELENSLDRYAALYDFAPVCYAHFDGHGRVRDINLTGTVLLGIERGRLVGMPFLPLVAADDRQTFLDHIHRCKGNNAETVTGIRLAPPTGKPIDVEMRTMPVRAEQGETVYRTAIIDFTERKRAEEMLRSSEELFHQLFEQNEEPLFLFRSRSSEIVDANPAAGRLYGHSREDLLRDGIRLFVPGEELPGFSRALAGIRPEEGLTLERVEHLRRDGGRVIVSVRGKSVCLASGLVSYCSFRDITSRVRMEEEAKLQQAQLIQASRMASIGMIVSGVAHEVNNPNNLIMFNAPMILSAWEDARPLLDARYRESGDFPLGGLPYSEMREVVPRLAAGISDASARIKAIVGNLKDLTRQDSSRAHVPVQVNDVVRAAVAILNHEILKATHRFEASFAEDLPLVTGSAQELEQVVINLLQNALQALPSSRCGLKVTTRRDPRTGEVEVEVADEGTGMSPEVLARLAEPFFSTRLDSGGMGLGLSISHTILNAHNGSLSFESEVGKGTRATVRLPAAGVAAEEPGAAREESRAMNEERLDLLESVHIPLVVVGTDLRIQHFTPHAAREFKLTPSDLGRLITDIRPNVEVRDIDAKIREVIASRVAQEEEVRDRQGFTYTLRIRPLKTGDRGISGAVIVLIGKDDIRRTREWLYEELRVHQEELEQQNLELRKTQEELEESRDRYANLYDFAPVCYVTFDGYGNIRDINLAGASLLGIERTRLVGMPFLSHIAPCDRQKFLDHIYRCKHGNGATVAEIRLAPSSGKPTDVEIRSVPIREDWGEISFRTAIIDVTDRKRAEEQFRVAHEALAENEKRIRSLMENLPVGVLIAAGGTVAFRNDFVERLLGKRPDAISPQEFPAVDPEDAKRFRRLCTDARRNRSWPHHEDIRFLVPEEERQTTRWVRFQTGRIGYRDEDALLIILADITRAKEMEQLLAVRERLASIGQISVGIAHEIRNPLSGINMYLSVIEQLCRRPEGLGPEERDRIVGILEQVKEASNKIASVIQRVMSFTKVSPISMEPVELNPPAEKAIHLSSGVLRRHGIDLIRRLSLGLPKCHANPRLIEQVLVNLIGNAAQALQNHKGPRQVEVASSLENGQLVLRVSDSGPGVPLHMRQKIFEPFFTTREDGYGIGLSFCRQVVAYHDGAISVGDSALGGAEFRIELPVQRGEASG